MRNVRLSWGTRSVAFLPLFFGGLLAAVSLLWLANPCPLTGIDDANIFFSYAENLASGRGITYAQNGVPVEGCTSLLWTFCCAACFLLRLDGFGVLVCSLALFAVAQLLWLKLLKRLVGSGSGIPFAIYGVLLLSSPGYVTWMSITLMDTVLWGALVAGFTLALAGELDGGRHSAFGGAACCLLMPWARPESLLVVPMGLAFVFALRLFRRRNVGRLVAWGLSFAASALALTLFRLAYFGYPFPNTYYAKVSPSLAYNLATGGIYVCEFLSSGLPTMLFLLLGFCWMVLPRRSQAAFGTGEGDALAFLWPWAFALLLPPLLTGGDHFAYHRFCQPLYPLICVLLAVALSRLGFWSALGRRLALAVAIGGILLCQVPYDSWPPHFVGRAHMRHEFRLAAHGIHEGRVLTRLFAALDEPPRVGTITAGGFARTYRGPIVDLMGLNDLTIAHHPGARKGLKNHAAFEPEIFGRLNVDVIRALPVGRAEGELKGLQRRPDFAAAWRCGRLALRNDPSCSAEMLVRKSFLDRALKTGTLSFADTYVWTGALWQPCR